MTIPNEALIRDCRGILGPKDDNRGALNSLYGHALCDRLERSDAALEQSEAKREEAEENLAFLCGIIGYAPLQARSDKELEVLERIRAWREARLATEK